eukprot:scaffold4562_cov255-Pinguiococcus_pyrenoidosus.AAC.11
MRTAPRDPSDRARARYEAPRRLEDQLPDGRNVTYSLVSDREAEKFHVLSPREQQEEVCVALRSAGALHVEADQRRISPSSSPFLPKEAERRRIAARLAKRRGRRSQSQRGRQSRPSPSPAWVDVSVCVPHTGWECQPMQPFPCSPPQAFSGRGVRRVHPAAGVRSPRTSKPGPSSPAAEESLLAWHPILYGPRNR